MIIIIVLIKKKLKYIFGRQLYDGYKLYAYNNNNFISNTFGYNKSSIFFIILLLFLLKLLIITYTSVFFKLLFIIRQYDYKKNHQSLIKVV